MRQVAHNWREADLAAPDRALCEFAAKLTHKQHEMGAPDLAQLRAAGFDDRAIHDATQVVAYFNYITRIADGLGVEPEDFIKPWAPNEMKPDWLDEGEAVEKG